MSAPTTSSMPGGASAAQLLRASKNRAAALRLRAQASNASSTRQEGEHVSVRSFTPPHDRTIVHDDLGLSIDKVVVATPPFPHSKNHPCLDLIFKILMPRAFALPMAVYFILQACSVS